MKPVKAGPILLNRRERRKRRGDQSSPPLVIGAGDTPARRNALGSALKQAKAFRGCPKMVVAPEGLFADSPIRPLAQPAEVQINSRGIQCARKAGGRAVRPAAAQILAHALPHDFHWPMFALCQRRQIDFAAAMAADAQSTMNRLRFRIRMVLASNSP